jgi:hypothetical protein
MTEARNLHSLEISILKVVTYFDVFSYPLTHDEIFFFLDRPVNEKEISAALKSLVKTRQLYRFNDLYSIRNAPDLVSRRAKGNELAIRLIKKARSVAKFLSWFPYIRGIAISGSLSKNFADENSDLDFFIITAANRLWIVRILYSLLYKIASLIRLKQWLCLNYFIDEVALEVEEHNVFTAVELSTLMPLKGKQVFQDFFHANAWVYKYLPNYTPNYSYLEDASPILPKRITEWLMNFDYGNKLDDKLQLFFKKRFERQITENKMSEKGLTIGAYQAEKHVCKPLPQYFQPVILRIFEERFKITETKYQMLSVTEKILASNV